MHAEERIIPAADRHTAVLTICLSDIRPLHIGLESSRQQLPRNCMGLKASENRISSEERIFTNGFSYRYGVYPTGISPLSRTRHPKPSCHFNVIEGITGTLYRMRCQ